MNNCFASRYSGRSDSSIVLQLFANVPVSYSSFQDLCALLVLLVILA